MNESGLYCLIMSSKLPSARKFKRWMKTVTLQKSSVKIAGGTGKLIP
ncbi:BRO family protein [Otoolea muris]|nr:BRO family protein [Otoolea muris]